MTLPKARGRRAAPQPACAPDSSLTLPIRSTSCWPRNLQDTVITLGARRGPGSDRRQVRADETCAPSSPSSRVGDRVRFSSKRWPTLRSQRQALLRAESSIHPELALADSVQQHGPWVELVVPLLRCRRGNLGILQSTRSQRRAVHHPRWLHRADAHAAQHVPFGL